MADCKRACPGGDLRFVQAGDLAAMRDVDRACTEITRLEREEEEQKEANRNIEKDSRGRARIALLVMSHARLTFDPRNGISILLYP